MDNEIYLEKTYTETAEELLERKERRMNRLLTSAIFAKTVYGTVDKSFLMQFLGTDIDTTALLIDKIIG